MGGRSTLTVRTLCTIIPFDQVSRETDKLGRRKYLVEKQIGSR
ncbi:hypothetical protein [Paenibacillus oralis]|nr:hypothetical protein [Paenibacillus oralis]